MFLKSCGISFFHDCPKNVVNFVRKALNENVIYILVAFRVGYSFFLHIILTEKYLQILEIHFEQFK